MNSTIQKPSILHKIRLYKTVNNGYFVLSVPNEIPTTRQRLFVQNVYTGSYMNLVYTVQDESTSYNVYVRTGDGQIPTNGLVVVVDILY